MNDEAKNWRRWLSRVRALSRMRGLNESRARVLWGLGLEAEQAAEAFRMQTAVEARGVALRHLQAHAEVLGGLSPKAAIEALNRHPAPRSPFGRLALAEEVLRLTGRLPIPSPA